MSPDRSRAPKIEPLQTITLLRPELFTAPNGLPIHVLRNVPNEIFHIQVEFGAGKIQQIKPLQSAFTAELLFSGTPEKSQFEIQELLDVQGAFVNVEAALTSSVLNIYGLVNNWFPILEVVDEVLNKASFPEDVFLLHSRASLQTHRINMDKNSYVARREFLSRLFPNNPIGKVADDEDFERITAQDCRDFYRNNWTNNVRQLNVVGAIGEEEIKRLMQIFDARHNPQVFVPEAPQLESPQTVYIEKPNALQSTIRIGKILFTPKHPDYFEMDILETILGGYFGSRLMQNLREDKGYTYGVGSGITTHEHTAYFFISTEVGKQHKDAALEAIRFELERLREELIPEDELELARAYIQGQVLKSSDGAFAQMNQFLYAKRFDLPENHLNQFLEILQAITPQRLRELAQKHLDWNSMTQVVVG